MANLINKTQLGTEYLNTIALWNGSNITKLDDSIVDRTFSTKEQLVLALTQLGVTVDANASISIEDEEMDQFHYFA
tara:strand:- start:1636 stop:1863 length:228 start_codon:yes stop_codon:yes gene_type:complete